MPRNTTHVHSHGEEHGDVKKHNTRAVMGRNTGMSRNTTHAHSSRGGTRGCQETQHTCTHGEEYGDVKKHNTRGLLMGRNTGLSRRAFTSDNPNYANTNAARCINYINNKYTGLSIITFVSIVSFSLVVHVY